MLYKHKKNFLYQGFTIMILMIPSLVFAQKKTNPQETLLKAGKCIVAFNLPCLQNILAKGFDPNHQDFLHKTTLLHVAAQFNNESAAKEILKYKVDPNMLDDHLFTPLHTAAYFNSMGVALILLRDNRVQPNLQPKIIDKNGAETSFIPALQLAAFRNSLEVLDVFLKPDNCSVQKNPNCPIDFNIQDKDGNTALHYALTEDHREFADKLMKSGLVNLSPIRDPSGPYLYIAIKNKNKDAITYLFEHSVFNPNRGDKQGNTAFHFAAMMNDAYTVSLFLQNPKLNVNQGNVQGRTALHFAASADAVDVVPLLLRDPRIDPNQGDQLGNSPLHCVAQFNSIRVAPFFLENESTDLNRGNIEGYTPLHVSAQYDQEEAAQIFLENPFIDPNQGTNNGETPLHIAARNNAKHVGYLLLKDRRVKRSKKDISKHDAYDINPQMIDELEDRLKDEGDSRFRLTLFR